MIGLKPDNFHAKYVRTGRLKAVIVGKKRGQNYFSLEDIEAILESNEHTISAREAAAICKVNISCIHKWTIAGDLKAVSGPNVDGFGYNLYQRGAVEKLHAQREAFKEKRRNAYGSARFGKPAGSNRRPVRSRIAPRIEQLGKRWSLQSPTRRISGMRMYHQLVREGYQVGLQTVYACLHELRACLSLA
jgi:hypothetical protein